MGKGHRRSHELQPVALNPPHTMEEAWAVDQVVPCAASVEEDCEAEEGTIAHIVCHCKATLPL